MATFKERRAGIVSDVGSSIDTLTREELDKQIESIRGISKERVASITGISGISRAKEFGLESERAIEQLQKDFLKSQITKKEGAREERRTELAGKEKQFLGELSAGAEATTGAIDAQLAGLLAETGIAANLARGQTGAAFASRGLGRSSFAAQATEEVTARELEATGGARLRAAERIGQVRRTETETRERIKEFREQEKIQKSLDEENLFREQLQNLEETTIRQANALFEANRELSSRDRQFGSQLIGNLFQAGASIFSGGS